MEPIWLKQYPPGIAAQIQNDSYGNLAELFNASCDRYADKPAFSNLGTTISYQQYQRYSHSFAAYLQQDAQLKRGDRLAIMLPNCLQYPVSIFAAYSIGLILVNVNPLYTVRECLLQLETIELSAIIGLTQYADLLAELARTLSIKTVILTELGDLLPPIKAATLNLIIRLFKKKIPSYECPQVISFRDAMQRGAFLKLTPVTVASSDLALLQPTGGTTGVPKLAMLSHQNLLANLAQISSWIISKVNPGEETIITALPLYHIFAFMANGLTFLRFGAHNVLITDPRNIKALIRQMHRYSFTCITGVNTLFNALNNHPDFSALNFSNFRITLGGGTAIQESVANRWQEITGVPLLQAYGLTEASPAVTMNRVTRTAYTPSVGLPLPSTEIQIRDQVGNEVGPEMSGELFIRGPQVMQGYWRNEEETQHVLDEAGWLATGDIVKLDKEGYVYLQERKKDIIMVSGFNVFPNEVEAVLMSHPDIKEAAVVAVDDPESGQRPKAFVVKNSHKLDKDTVIAYCRANLTNYKRPTLIEFIEELPKSNVGKILRKELR